MIYISYIKYIIQFLLFTIYICNLLISKANEKRTKTISSSKKNYPWR